MCHRVQHGIDCRFRYLIAIQTGLAGIAHREFAGGPDIAGIHLGIGLQDGHAPTLFAIENGPVQRRRPAVTTDTGMYNQADMLAPDTFGNGTL